MKRVLAALLLLLPACAQAGGGRNPNVPDRFFQTLGFILFMAVAIYLIDKFRK